MDLFWRHGFDSASLSLRRDMVASGSSHAAFRAKAALSREAVGLCRSGHGKVAVPLLDGSLPPRGRIEQAWR